MNTNPFPSADHSDPIARGIARQTPVQRPREAANPVRMIRTVDGSVVEIFEHRSNGVLMGIITLPKPIAGAQVANWKTLGYEVNLEDHLVDDLDAYLDFVGEPRA